MEPADCNPNGHTFFLADLHLYSPAIIKHTKRTWALEGPALEACLAGRPYEVNRDTAAWMNFLIVERINRRVGPDDRLVLVGDVVTANTAAQAYGRTVFLLERLRCKNVHLVLGNHDCAVPNVGYAVTDAPQYRQDFRKAISLPYRSVHDACLFVCHGGITVWASHYPHITWPNASKTGLPGHASLSKTQSIHVYGHVHNSWMESPVSHPERWCAVNVGTFGNENWPLRDDEISAMLAPQRKAMIAHILQGEDHA